jgi:chromosome segregation ATPase
MALEELASERCDRMERQIAETASASAEMTSKLDESETAATRLELRSQIDFADMRLRGLIEGRIGLEEARLKEIADAADCAANLDNPLPDLIAQRKPLQDKLDALEVEIQRASHVSQSLSRKQITAQQFLGAFQSLRPVDQPIRDSMMRELRERLERLGHA